MDVRVLSPEETNARNRVFWEERNKEFWRQLGHSFIVEQVMKDVQRDIDRHVPVGFRLSMEDLAELNEERLKDTQRYSARRGGLAKKTDALQQRIIELVRGNPQLTSAGVLAKLRDTQGPAGVVCDVTEQHISIERSDGRIEDVPISGLKDRVSRARKALRTSA